MSGKKFIFIVVIAVILLVKGIVPLHFGNDNIYYLTQKDSLDCAIILDNDMYSSKGRPVGFHYELLRLFGDYTSTTVIIDPPAESPICWEKLLAQEYDILVVNIKDSVPAAYKERILLTAPIRDNYHWAVAKENTETLNSINFWFAAFKRDKSYKQVTNRYFRSYRIEPYIEGNLQANALSPYDGIIKKYSKYIGLDWRLLSSVVYQESRYSIGAASHRKAQGLMQVKSSTAKRYGIENIYDPELNVKAGTLHIDYLCNLYRKEGLDSANVIKFALGAYNAGEGRIQESREVAAANGLNPDKWEEVTQAFSIMNNFSGKETIRYVDEVLARFEQYKTVIN